MENNNEDIQLFSPEDNKLLAEFFRQEAVQMVPDEGFTERVMARIEQMEAAKAKKLRWQTRLWTWFCIALGIALFLAMNGMEIVTAVVTTSVKAMMLSMITTDISINPWLLVLMVAFVGVYLPYQTARKLSAAL